jgi:hypothetical protein
VRIYFATGLVDMRNGIDGLRTIVEQVLKRNPNEGHLFVFMGKRRDIFVGDLDAGMSIAGLYTLVSTCEARALNPFAYLADVIPRVQDHPKRRLDELLPGPWARARADAWPVSQLRTKSLKLRAWSRSSACTTRRSRR